MITLLLFEPTIAAAKYRICSGGIFRLQTQRGTNIPPAAPSMSMISASEALKVWSAFQKLRRSSFRTCQSSLALPHPTRTWYCKYLQKQRS